MNIDLDNALSSVGNWISELTQSGLSLLDTAGIITSSATAKIISILVVLAITWLILHFLTFLKTPVKVAIIVLCVILIISVLVTFA